VTDLGQLKSRVSILLYRSPRLRILAQSLVIALSAYLTAVLAAQVAKTYTDGGWADVGIQAAAFVIVISIVLFVVRLYALSPGIKVNQRAQVLATAHSQVDGCVAEQLGQVCGIQGSVDTGDLVPFDSRSAIHHLVRALYTCVDSHYGSGDVPGERLNFEVTFMTRDYGDGEITIIAWASRDGRAPKSLAERKRNPRTYSTSVTADLYRESENQQVRTRITSDTSSNYAELYPGQKQRIKSSIVRPVLSASNDLLGTLVLHCDQTNFFRLSDEKYWSDLMDVFGIRIALHKAELDWQNDHGSASTTS
jgi:hypothetical protein